MLLYWYIINKMLCWKYINNNLELKYNVYIMQLTTSSAFPKMWLQEY